MPSVSDCAECSSSLESVRGFFAHLGDQEIPFSATLELTYRCNFECVHCYCVIDPAKTPAEMTTEEWKRVLDDLARAGTLAVSFTGGDPFVRKDFFEIAEYAREKRFAVRLLTNASFLNDRNADRLAALQPAHVSISLYGATPETYAAVTGDAAFFEKSIAGIRRLKDRGVRMQIKIPLLKESFHERHQLVALAKELGTSWRIDAEVGPKDDGNLSPLAHQLDDEQLARYVAEYEPPYPKEHEPFKPGDRLCRPGSSSFAIGPYGDVYPCMQIKRSMGNLRERPFDEIWRKSEPLLAVRALRAEHFDGCNACGHFGACKPCPGTSQTLTGSLTAPTSTTCRITEARSRLPIVRSDSPPDPPA